MAGIKVYVPDDVEGEFRRLAMAFHGYGRGSISKAAEEAFRQWIRDREALLKEVEVPEDPVSAIRGMLKGLKRSGVELQHKARKVRVVRVVARD